MSAVGDDLTRAVEQTPSFVPANDGVADLLGEVRGLIRRFVVLSDVQADTLALWVLHTHTFDAAEVTPYLSITSAEKESGKTHTLKVLSVVVARPWETGRVTAAVLTRKVDKEKPTLLLDESDAAFKGEKEYAEALRGLLNTGYEEGGVSSTCVGQGANVDYMDWSTYCPKAIAGIDKLPDTVESRSIHIRLKRRAPGEPIEKLRRRKLRAEAAPIRVRLEEWATRNTDRVEAAILAEPELPDALRDRAMDVWEPLVAIADLAGGDWPQRARTAALSLSGRGEVEDQSYGVMLLADARELLTDRDRITSKEFVGQLCDREESPWGGWQTFTQSTVAKLLKGYGIRPASIRITGQAGTCKGYRREQFQDAFSRYLPSQAAHRHNPHSNGEKDDPRDGTSVDVCRQQRVLDPTSQAESAVVPGESPDHGYAGSSNGHGPVDQLLPLASPEQEALAERLLAEDKARGEL